jgi:hypothetical protein
VFHCIIHQENAEFFNGDKSHNRCDLNKSPQLSQQFKPLSVTIFSITNRIEYIIVLSTTRQQDILREMQRRVNILRLPKEVHNFIREACKTLPPMGRGCPIGYGQNIVSS